MRKSPVIFSFCAWLLIVPQTTTAQKRANQAQRKDLFKAIRDCENARISRGGETWFDESRLAQKLKLIEEILEDRALVNARRASYRRVWTPLHVAIKQDNPALVRLLIDHGADVNATGEFGRTPALVYATKTERWHVVDILLREQAIDVSAGSSSGFTALHAAAAAGRVDLAERLLDRGVEINAVERGRYTPLHWACWNNHLGTARLLVTRGANVNFQADVKKPLSGASKTHESPLHGAADARWPQSAETVAFLLNSGARVDAVDGQGKTPLHVAAKNFGNAEIVKLLINHGADVNRTDGRPGFRQQTPLQYAASRGHEPAVRILLSHGAEVDKADYSNYTALFLACCGKRASIVRQLLEKGANPSGTSVTYHETPLHRAVSTADLPTVELLLKYGAQTAAKNAEGRTPLDLALQNVERGTGDAERLRVCREIAEVLRSHAQTAP